MSRRITVDPPWFRVESDNGTLCWDGRVVFGGRAISVAHYARIGPRGQWRIIWERTFPIERGQLAGLRSLGATDKRHVIKLHHAIVYGGKATKNPARRVVSKVKPGKSRVRCNSAAEDRSNDLIAVDNAPDGLSAVTMLHYGKSRQYFGLYDWVPNKGRGFQVSFTWHLDEGAARADSGEAARLTSHHAKMLHSLAKKATSRLLR